MPFKIIETIERGRRLIATVPSLWESDGNLYWPRKNVIPLKKNENSSPQSEWKCLPCILLRDNILDYKTAEQEIALMSDATDSDNKENEYPRRNTSIALDLNNLAMECIQASKVAEERSSMVAAAENSSSNMIIEDASSVAASKNSSSIVAEEEAPSVIMVKDLSSIMAVESNTLIPSDATNIEIQDASHEHASNPIAVSDIQDNILQLDETLLLPELDQHPDPQFSNTQTTITESIQVPQQIGCFIEMASAIQENQKILFENQQNMIKGLALLNTKLDEFITRSQGPRLQLERHEQSSRFKMITNITELTNFEEQLKDHVIEKKYFEELSIICSEKLSGHNNAYALVDTMFDRKFMTRCSWGGGTKGEPKYCFKAFLKTIELFLKIVHQHDKSFTKPVCEDFFKNVMRHSAKRNTAKRVRNSTTKTKNKKSATANKLQDKNRPGLSNVSDATP